MRMRSRTAETTANRKSLRGIPVIIMLVQLSCRTLIWTAVGILTANIVVPACADIEWPTTEYDANIREIHAEIGKPLQLSCSLTLENVTEISSDAKFNMIVWHRHSLAPATTHIDSPIYGVLRPLNESKKVIARGGTWLDPKLQVFYGSMYKRTNVIRKMTDHIELVRKNSSSWNATFTFVLKVPGVAGTGSFFGVQIRLPPHALLTRQCVFLVTTYGCPMDLRLEVFNTTLPHNYTSKNEKLRIDCYYTAYQPGSGQSAALSVRNLPEVAGEITVGDHHNDTSVIPAVRRVEYVRGRPDLLRAEVPAEDGYWKQHEIVHNFELGQQNSSQRYDVVCRATVYKDLRRWHGMHANDSIDMRKQVMCFGEILQTYPNALEEDDDEVSAAGIFGIIAICSGVLIILLGVVYGLVRHTKGECCWSNSPATPMRPRQQYISSSSGSGTAADGKASAPPMMITTASAAERGLALHKQNSFIVARNLKAASSSGGAGAVIYPNEASSQLRPVSSSGIPSTQSSPVGDMTHLTTSGGDTDSDRSFYRRQNFDAATNGYDTVDRASCSLNTTKFFEQQTTTHTLTRPYKIGRGDSGSYNVRAAAAAASEVSMMSGGVAGQPVVQKQRFRLGSGEVVPFSDDDEDAMAMRSNACVFVRSAGGNAKLSPAEGSNRSSGTSKTNVSSVTTNVVGEI